MALQSVPHTAFFESRLTYTPILSTFINIVELTIEMEGGSVVAIV